MSLPRRVYQRLLNAVRNRDGAEADICPWCERPFASIPSRLHVHGDRVQEQKVSFEHIVAKRDGGTWDVDNLVLACVWCNCRREELAHAGVQDETRVIGSLLSAEQQRQAERERRRDIALAGVPPMGARRA